MIKYLFVPFFSIFCSASFAADSPSLPTKLFLVCNHWDGSGGSPTYLLYSPDDSIRYFAKLDARTGVPEKYASSIHSFRFYFDHSYMFLGQNVQTMMYFSDIGKQYIEETILINRKSLVIQHNVPYFMSDFKGGFERSDFNYTYRCDIMNPGEAESIVQKIKENRAKEAEKDRIEKENRAKNSPPNKI